MWAVLASGQSLTAEQVDYIRSARSDGRLNGFIAVSNVGIDLAPDADAIVSHDAAWWRVNRSADDFKGYKFCRDEHKGTTQFIPSVRGCNSGLMAMEIAFKIFQADRIILLGFDMHGTHYFGKHPDNLKNSSEIQFKRHLEQFNYWNGCDIINCTPNSRLVKFPMIDLKDAV